LQKQIKLPAGVLLVVALNQKNDYQDAAIYQKEMGALEGGDDAIEESAHINAPWNFQLLEAQGLQLSDG
jgi:hypothetical protein